MPTAFHAKLRSSIDSMVHDAYKLSKLFPKDELQGATSQLRRSALSVALNYTEGFARRSRAVNRNFADIAYGSIQEAKYVVRFALGEGWVGEADALVLLEHMDEIGRMIWGIVIRSIKKDACSVSRVA